MVEKIKGFCTEVLGNCRSFAVNNKKKVIGTAAGITALGAIAGGVFAYRKLRK